MPRPPKNNQHLQEPENPCYDWVFATLRLFVEMAYLQPYKNNLTPICTNFYKIHDRTSLFSQKREHPRYCQIPVRDKQYRGCSLLYYAPTWLIQSRIFIPILSISRSPSSPLCIMTFLDFSRVVKICLVHSSEIICTSNKS